MERNPNLERRLWAVTVRELEHAQDHMLLLSRMTACERVASFLLESSGRVGADRFDLAMGRQDMADYLGLTIETVSRMLTQLQRSNLIEVCSLRTVHIRARQTLAELGE